MNVVDRIRARIKVDENGCHVFQGALDRGYGRVGIGRKAEYAHRVMFEAANGPIPDGLHIDHLCRNRSCCNPAHLEAVTQAENNRRAMAVKYPGVRGVYQTNASSINPWRAEIRMGGKNVYLGLFPNREQAVAARLKAERATPERKAAIEAEVAGLEKGAES